MFLQKPYNRNGVIENMTTESEERIEEEISRMSVGYWVPPPRFAVPGHALPPGSPVLVSHHQGMANVMDNQVATIIKLKKQLSQKNSVDMLVLEKDKHLGEKADRIEVLQNIMQVKDRQF